MAEKPGSSLISYVYSAGRSSLVLSVQKVMFGLATFMCALMLGNAVLACSTQFHCGKYLPTPGYLGCFKGHDRIFILSCAYYALVLPLVFTGVYSQTRTSASYTEQWVLLGTSLGIVTLLPLTALMDEVTSEHFINFEGIYEYTSRMTVLACYVWIITSYICLSKDKSIFTAREKTWYTWFQVFVVSISTLLVLVAVQIYVPVMSDYSESMCEWVLCLLGIWTPAVVAQLVRGLHLSFSTVAIAPGGKELSDLGKK